MVRKIIDRATVRKNVAAIHISGDLSLIERKLVNILLLNAYDNLLTKTIHTIPFDSLCDMLGWDTGHDVETIKSALKNIMTTMLEYDVLNKKAKLKQFAVAPLMAFARLENGICSYQYSQFLAEELADPEIYATINLNVQNQFHGGYAFTLYENCLRFKNIGTTGWIEVGLWRSLLGAGSSHYDDFRNLSRDVIKRGVIEVNAVSDIEIAPEFQREKRKVTNIRFSVKDNTQVLANGMEAISSDSIRESITFKRLVAHGVGEKLAMIWMIQDPERAQKAVSHTEEIDEMRPLNNPAGYLRTIYESGNTIGAAKAKEQRVQEAQEKKTSLITQELAQSRQDAAAAAAKHAAQELAQQQRSKACVAAISALNEQQMRDYAGQYVAGAGVGYVTSFAPDATDIKKLFTKILERAAFTAWLRGQLVKSSIVLDQ